MGNVKINSTFWALIIGAIFGGLANQFDNWQVVDSFIGGLCVSAFTEIYLIIRQHIPTIAATTTESNKKLQSTEEFIDLLLDNRQKIDKIKSNLYLRQPFVKDVSIELFDYYLSGFKIIEGGGFRVEGQELALKMCLRLWYLLALEQEKLNNNKEEPLFARVTHSNDISIWNTELNPIVHDIMTYQKLFLSHGGRIVRFIIGEHLEENSDEEYKNVIEMMRKAGIEVYYFHHKEVNETDFDYLYLVQKKLILKWISGQQGKRISAFELSDIQDEEMRHHWDTLLVKAQEKNKKIIIPEDKQFGLLINTLNQNNES